MPAGQVPEDQDKLLGEAKRLVDKNAFEMKSSLVCAMRGCKLGTTS